MSEAWKKIKTEVEKYKKDLFPLFAPARTELDQYIQDKMLEETLKVTDERGVKTRPIIVKGEFVEAESYLPKEKSISEVIKKAFKIFRENKEIENIKYEVVARKTDRGITTSVYVYIYTHDGSVPLYFLEILSSENKSPFSSSVRARAYNEFGAKLLDEIMS